MEPYFLKLAKKRKEKNENIIIRNDDIITRILSRPRSWTTKLFLLDPKVSVFDKENISEDTLKAIKKLQKYSPETKIYVGTSPVFDAAARAFMGKGTVYNSLIGRPFGTISAVIGGLHGKLTSGDYYSPSADIVSIRSDIPAVAAHEIGHAVDFHSRKHPTLYFFLTNVKPFNLIREANASQFAGENLTNNRETLKILTPAFGSYVAGFPGILGGHLLKNTFYFGRAIDRNKNKRKKHRSK